MASWEQWMPELSLAAPTAPVPLLHQCLNRAARAFLRRTRAWREWLEPASITGEKFQEYTFELPQGSELFLLERATMNGRPIAVANAGVLSADPWRAEGGRGQAHLISTDLRNFTVGTHGATGSLQVYVLLQPTLRATTIPDTIAALYHEGIREGAKAELLNTSGTDYYRPDQAAVSFALFNQAIDDASVEVWRGNTGRLPRGRIAWL